MTDINEIWQADIAERGDKAFELFFVQGGIEESFCPESNEMALIDMENLELLPIAELIKLDIERYGENAFFMYEWQVDDCEHPLINDCGYYPLESNDSIKSHIEAGNDIRRKTHANVPFNIEWAKAGVKVEFLNPISNNWELVTKKGDMDSDAMLVIFDDCPTGLWIEPIDLRHPFPPAKELQL